MSFTRFEAQEAGSHPGGAGRRWLAILVILAVAMAGALLGQMSVVRDDAVVGLISDRDVRLVAGLSLAEKLQVRAGDIMVTEPLTVAASAPLQEVALKMASLKVGSAIVNDEDGRLLGIFTATDALNALVEVIRGTGTRWTHTG